MPRPTTLGWNRLLPAAIALPLLAGCTGIQSSLAPAGREADGIADLFWWMAGSALAVWVGVMALAVYCVRVSPDTRTPRRDRLLIVGGGVILPIVVLTILLVYGLAALPPLVARAPEGALQVTVIGEQWWWRVRYLRPGGDPVEIANEIRLPARTRVQFRLESDNVIHSFWIPPLAGKMDMIPGRVTWLAMQAEQPGVYRGVCAEYCGASHALMSFYVEVMEPEAFDGWLARQAGPAPPPSGAAASRGEQLFRAAGCGACHTVRGTPARGVVGPDLTHVAGRLSIGAGILPNTPAALARWIAGVEALKPGAHMPSFGMLPQADVAAIAAYLSGLE